MEVEEPGQRRLAAERSGGHEQPDQKRDRGGKPGETPADLVAYQKDLFAQEVTANPACSVNLFEPWEFVDHSVTVTTMPVASWANATWAAALVRP